MELQLATLFLDIEVRWNHRESLIEFLINGEVVEKSDKYHEFWPEKFLDTTFLGTWGTKDDIHYINLPLYRVITSVQFLDDNWVKNEQEKKPSNDF